MVMNGTWMTMIGVKSGLVLLMIGLMTGLGPKKDQTGEQVAGADHWSMVPIDWRKSDIQDLQGRIDCHCQG